MDLFIKYSNTKYADERRKIAKYLELLDWQRFVDVTKVDNIGICPCDYKQGNEFPPLNEFVPFANGSYWGDKPDFHAWFHFAVDVERPNTYLRIFTERNGTSTTNPQFIVYVNGKAVQGMDTNHRELPLAVGHNDVYVYGYIALHLTTAQFTAQTCVLQSEVDKLYYDIRYPFKALEFWQEDSEQYADTVKHLYNAINMLYCYDLNSSEFIQSVRKAQKYLDEEYFAKHDGQSDATTVCIGHTHIDCAWLWQLKQTREKVQRSFATVLQLMERYPEYKFMASQPLQYQYLKEENPQLYEQVKQRIAENRWECEGAMWVESDCNLPCGESLIRQINYGKDFFKSEFGKDNHVLWLPDVFGYPASLPQILNKSGIDWFVTSKISWNDTNKMPYDTFEWVGIDGTKVNTYFLTGQDCDTNDSVTYTSYVGETDSTWINGTYKRYQQKDLNNKVLLPFGWGDGGGGPTSEQLELIRRGTNGLPNCPKTEYGFVGDFLDELSEKMRAKHFPKWNGELYFEYHRGTYTTMANNKKNNRKSEFLLLNAESNSVLANKLLGATYPTDKLDDSWKKVLTNQFHDIIPGSSIRQVYEDSDKDYQEIFATGNGILQSCYDAVSQNIDVKRGYVVFNNNGFSANGTVTVNGKTALVQNVPANGYTVTNDFVTANHVKIDGKVVDTDVYTVTFDDAWQIKSVYDKANDREVIPSGGIGNELRLYEDYPDDFDAWDWKKYNRNSWLTLNQVESVAVVDDGARRGIRVVRKFFNSQITQTIWFYDAINKIDFATTVDWHEQHKMLKVAFPVDVNTDKATYDIQFGTVQRPTHFNTSWDQAKFETCGHKFVDVSDSGFGVSLLNDCKYGHDVHEGVVQLSLLRGTTYPNEVADQGKHEFVYSLTTHAGTLQQSNTLQLAYLLNNPLVAVKATGSETSLPSEFSLVTVDKSNVICSSIKQSKDGDGVIVRLYESTNAKTKAHISFGFDVKSVTVADMLENDLYNVEVNNNAVDINFDGFGIITLKIK